MVDARNPEDLRARAESAGLALTDERLELLADSLEGIEDMLEAMRTVPVDPTDIVMEPFDPAWPEDRT